MARRLKSKGRALKDQRGVSMTELLVYMAMSLLLAGAAAMLLIVAVKSQPRISSRDDAIQMARVTQERLARELRQSYSVQSATASQITFFTYARRVQCGGAAQTNPATPAIACRVTYTCAAGVCDRTETNPAGTSQPYTARLVKGISNSDVFAYRPSSTPAAISYVATKLVFPAKGGDDAITLEDGVNLRNR